MIAGSTALRYHGVNITNTKDVVDLDVFLYDDEQVAQYGVGCDVHVIPKHIYLTGMSLVVLLKH